MFAEPLPTYQMGPSNSLLAAGLKIAGQELSRQGGTGAGGGPWI